MFSCLGAKQSQTHEHSAAAAAEAAILSSTRATLDSSSTPTPVDVVVVLLRTARAALEGTSMSRFQSMPYYTAKKKGHGTTITRLLSRNQHETNTSTAWTSNHEHSAATTTAAAGAPTTLEQHSPRAALVRLLLLLLFCFCVLLEHELEQHGFEQHCCCVLLQLQQEVGKTNSLRQKHMKIRVGFQAPGRVSGGGTPSPD